MKWEKVELASITACLWVPGLPQELYKMYFRAVCLSGREHPSAPAPPWGVQNSAPCFTWEGTQKGPGAPSAAVCPRALCGCGRLG